MTLVETGRASITSNLKRGRSQALDVRSVPKKVSQLNVTRVASLICGRSSLLTWGLVRWRYLTLRCAELRIVSCSFDSGFLFAFQPVEAGRPPVCHHRNQSPNWSSSPHRGDNDHASSPEPVSKAFCHQFHASSYQVLLACIEFLRLELLGALLLLLIRNSSLRHAL